MMTISIISFLLGWISGILVRNWVVELREERRRFLDYSEEVSKCPHGFVDWDECPVCGH